MSCNWLDMVKHFMHRRSLLSSRDSVSDTISVFAWYIYRSHEPHECGCMVCDYYYPVVS